MTKPNINKQALALHKKHGGKIEVCGKMPVRNRAELGLAYTPGVAAVSVEIGKNPKLAYDYTLKKNTVAVVSDGSAILGLGNLGALAALPVMEGKALLFKQMAGVDAFPICLDTQDTEEIIHAVKMIAPAFGGINLEDISAPRCFEVERRLRAELNIPVMHDDQHGTAVVVLAGLINALKLRKLSKEKAKVVISGVGAAGTAIARILLSYGFKNILLCDSKGVLALDRSDMNAPKLALLADIKKTVGHYEKFSGTLQEALAERDIFIGVSKGGLLGAADIKTMNPKPIIFAMSNPTPEIMPDEAKKGGAFIVGTGRSDFPNQLNNVLAFPGIFRGVLDNRVKQFEESMFVRVAEKLAKTVAKPTVDKIVPDPFDKKVMPAVASAFKRLKSRK